MLVGWLWHTIKHKAVYLQAHNSVSVARASIARDLHSYMSDARMPVSRT